MLYRVKVEQTPKFNTSERINSKIYQLVYERTNGICEIEYNQEVQYIFKDIHTGIIHDLSSSLRLSCSTLFLKEELESFTQLPVFTDTPTSDDTELLEYFLEKFMLTRDKVRQQIANNKKRKAIEAKIKELEKEYNEIEM